MRPHPAQAIERAPWLPSAPSPRDCARGPDPRRSPGRHVGRCPAALRRVEKRCPSPGPSDPAAVREAVTHNDTLVSTPLGLRPTVHPRSPSCQRSASVWGPRTAVGLGHPDRVAPRSEHAQGRACGGAGRPPSSLSDGWELAPTPPGIYPHCALFEGARELSQVNSLWVQASALPEILLPGESNTPCHPRPHHQPPPPTLLPAVASPAARGVCVQGLVSQLHSEILEMGDGPYFRFYLVSTSPHTELWAQ